LSAAPTAWVVGGGPATRGCGCNWCWRERCRSCGRPSADLWSTRARPRPG
jgi:hypothetical protein